MRRPIASTLAAAAIFAGLALQGGAALAQETLDPLCLDYASDDHRLLLRESSMVVLGEVEAGQGEDEVRIVPERFLKGPTSRGSFGLERMDNPECSPAELEAGQRVLLVLGSEEGSLAWPSASQAFVLRDGSAELMSGELTMNAEELVDDIRAITGQSSEPATEDAEGADIDWIGTVVPVTAGVVIVLGIGLVLMKEWHRIDPS